MRLLFTISIVVLVTTFNSCRSENRDNARAYVEGKITGTQLDYNKIAIVLKSDDKNIAETIPTGAGEFVLSGPLLNDSFSLVISLLTK